MRNILRLLPLLLILTIVAACSNKDEEKDDSNASNENEKAEVKIKPEEIADTFLKGDYKQVYDQTNQTFKEEIGEKQFAEIGEQFNEEAKEISLEAKMNFNGATRLVWTDEESTQGIMATVDESNLIVGFQVLFFESYLETDEVLTENRFIYPFEEEWLVFWGGTNPLVNYHYAQASQRYAYDFIKIKDDRSFSEEPEKNENYYTFGQEVIAPADGIVVDMVNNIKDNVPGEMNGLKPAGNYVVIDHGHDEYSLLAHFKEGTIEVETGDEVKQGDPLGEAGNSGNSSEPHIHFQVMDDEDFEKGEAIRINFVSKEDPVQGDIVEQ